MSGWPWWWHTEGIVAWGGMRQCTYFVGDVLVTGAAHELVWIMTVVGLGSGSMGIVRRMSSIVNII